jgi:hypothetical protein
MGICQWRTFSLLFVLQLQPACMVMVTGSKRVRVAGENEHRSCVLGLLQLHHLIHDVTRIVGIAAGTSLAANPLRMVGLSAHAG